MTDSPRSKLEALPHRILCAVVGAALIGSFFLPWLQLDDTALGRLSGFELTVNGFQSSSSHALLLILPLIGIGLVAVAWWGRRRASMTALIVTGLVVVLGGAWQTLIYVAAAIGPGLWIVAATGLAALLGGLPWQAIVDRRKAEAPAPPERPAPAPPPPDQGSQTNSSGSGT